MRSELRVKPNQMRPGESMVEIWHGGKMIGAVYPSEGPGVRVITKHKAAVSYTEVSPGMPIAISVLIDPDVHVGSVGLDFEPEPVPVLTDRARAAFGPLYYQEQMVKAQLAGEDYDRPGKHREHVFDYESGLRIILSREALAGRIGNVLHASVSAHRGTMLESLRTAARSTPDDGSQRERIIQIMAPILAVEVEALTGVKPWNLSIVSDSGIFHFQASESSLT